MATFTGTASDNDGLPIRRRGKLGWLQRPREIACAAMVLAAYGGEAFVFAPDTADAAVPCGDFRSVKIDCEDVSPTTETFGVFPDRDLQQSVSGRILSLTATSAGQRLYAGTFAGVWRSDDQGQTWHQLVSRQPHRRKIQVPGALAVPNVLDVVVSPISRNRVLAATAHDTRVPAQSKSGIYLSSNGGTRWHLVHQFDCQGSPDPGRATQIVFAPDDPRLVYAAGGCAVAISRNGGRTWVESPIVDALTGDAGTVWHVAVAPREGSRRTGFMRRLYAVGDDQIWYSEDGGITWFKDRGAIPDANRPDITKLGPFGSFPGDCCSGSSSQIHIVEPGRPDHILLAVPSIMNGPRYYDPSVPDGFPCDVGNLCGGGSVWLGDYSGFSQSPSATWTRLADPPSYFGGSTPSGRLYLVTKETARGYLLFFSDGSHVHVSEGRPEATFFWHRLDGRDASQSKLDDDRLGNNLFNKLFVHVDPHAIAVSDDFDIVLTRAAVIACPIDEQDDPLKCPYNQNSVLDPSVPPQGTIWMGNDGGIYFSTEGGVDGSWQLAGGLATLQPQFSFAGVASQGSGPGLYFGVPDNDNFFSLDGGETWQDPLTRCFDCGPWFADPAQPERVLESAARDSPPGLALYVDPAGGLPDASDAALRKAIPLPGRCTGPATPPCPAGQSHVFEASVVHNPIVLTAAGEDPLADGDYALIRQKPDGTRVVLRTTKISQITRIADWETAAMEDGPGIKVFQQGPPFIRPEMDSAGQLRTSGGHDVDVTVFFVGDPGFTNGLWKWTRGMPNWRRIVPAPDGSAIEARRFYVDPYDPDLIYIIDGDAIRRSSDGGLTWQVDASLDQAVTENGAFGYQITPLPASLASSLAGAVITDMVFDRGEPGTRFALGNAGVFFTLDGQNWERLLSTTALPGHPVAAYFDPISDSLDRALYVAFNGRGIVQLTPIPAR